MRKSPARPRPSDPRTLARIARSPRLFLALDVDGTLLPIRPTPGAVYVPARVKALVRAWTALPDCTVALVSGRSLANVRRLIGLRGLTIAGNHGFEIAGPWGLHQPAGARRARPVLQQMVRELQRTLRGIRGVIIEDKRWTVSIHYRRVQAAARAKVQRHICTVAQPYVTRRQVQMTQGKMVIEVRPPVAWGKGHAVAWMLRQGGRVQTLPIIIGDDTTDEDAFRKFPTKAVTIRVGRATQPSAASFALASPQDVVRFLERIYRLRTHGRPDGQRHSTR